MSQQATPEPKPFWLEGNFAPIDEERTVSDLRVQGALPKELNGRFFRNGSNPISGTSDHWFLGNGMIHGLRISGGKALWYRNRYVRTPLIEEPDADPIASMADRSRSLANTHVICHAGKILALEEAHLPWEVSPDLETVGAHDYDGKLQTGMTAHPRTCPETGELLFFGYSPIPPYLTYHRVSPDGKLVQSEEIDVKGPTMMHDWNVTRNHVIFMDLPMVFDLAQLGQGGLPIRWDDDYGARLGVMPRNGSNADVTWYEIDPCYVFHPMNAYEEGDSIVLDVSRFPKFSMLGGDMEPAMLHRWTIDTAAGKVGEQPLDDRPADFPRVHDARVGLKHRIGYMAATGAGFDEFGRKLLKFDLESGKSWEHDFGPGHQGGEPVFAPTGPGEEEGYVMTFVYDKARNTSDFVVLDAVDFEKPPVATVPLPGRVPMGFHGSWIAD